MPDRVTFAEVLQRNRGVGPGFDLLRIGLAFAIFYGHTLWVAGAGGMWVPGAAAAAAATDPLAIGGWVGFKRPIHVVLVPMFFALSGFLVTGSAVRLTSVSTFLANRGLRIFPALAVELSLSALCLGPLLTDLSAASYFASPAFVRYFGNLIGVVTFALPGVFFHNPVAGVVNVNLWTLPAEFDCYVIIAVVMAAGLLRSRVVFTALLGAYTLVAIILNATTSFAVTPAVYAPHTITYYFFMGVALFLWRDRVPYSAALFALSAAASYLLLFSHHTVYLAPPFVAYCTTCIGLTRLPHIKLISRGDYSYGFYLYGFPISQAVIATLPQLRGHYWIVLMISTALTAMFAVFSWHVIERPTLSLKRRLPQRWFPTGRVFSETAEQPTQRPV